MGDERARVGGRRPTLSRRRFLATAGAGGLTAPFAGCSDLIGGGGPTETGTSGAEGTRTGTPGGGPQPEGVVTWVVHPDAVAEHDDAIAAALYESGLSEDVDVAFVAGDRNPDQRRADYGRSLGEGDQQPDVFLMDVGWVQAFQQRGQLHNLSELLGEETLATIDAEYFDGLTATARAYDTGDLFGVPIAADFSTMQYRIDLVEAAGYSPVENDWATEPMTWEEWSHVTADVAEAADVEFGFTTQWDIYEGTACCTFNEVLTSWGGAYFGGSDTLFGPVGDRPVTVDAEPVVQSLEMMRRFVHDEAIEGFGDYAGGVAPADILGWIEGDAREPFARRNAVMHRNWSSSLAELGRHRDETAGRALGADLGAMPMPYAVPPADAQAAGAGGPTAALGGWHATVNPNSQNLEAVARVLESATEPTFQLELLSLREWLPPRPDLFETNRARDATVLGRYLDTLRVAGDNAMPHPATHVWNDEASVIAQQANRVVAQEISPAAGMGELATSLEEIERAG